VFSEVLTFIATNENKITAFFGITQEVACMLS